MSDTAATCGREYWRDSTVADYPPYRARCTTEQPCPECQPATAARRHLFSCRYGFAPCRCSGQPVTSAVEPKMALYDQGAVDALRSLAESFAEEGMQQAAEITFRAAALVEDGKHLG